MKVKTASWFTFNLHLHLGEGGGGGASNLHISDTCCMVHRYVETSDGEVRMFEAGDILFQDNTANSPAAIFPNLAKHISGQVGDQPCNIVVTQVNFNPTVDQPCPF